MLPERFNATRILDDQLDAGRADAIAVRTSDEELTYSDLADLVCQAGNLFPGRGIHPEQRVLLVLDDSPAFIAAFLGAMRIGAIPVCVNPLDRADNFTHYVRDTNARICLCDAALEESLRAAGASQLMTESEFRAALRSHPNALSAADTHRDDPAFWLYSSGSTGLPKGVVHLHHDMAVTFENYAKKVLRISPEDICYSTTKLFHAYGLGNSLTFPLSAGASSVLVSGRSNPAAALANIERFRPTLFFSVPALYRAMLNEPTVDVGSVRVCVSAAEALPGSTAERWKDRYGVDITDGIGSTEMLHIYCSNRPDGIRLGTSGTPVPGYELRIDETGELLVKGDSCAALYWHQHEKTKRCMKGEWFATGDRYHVTDDGFYVYEGRVDDMLKAGGLWVSPTDLEACLMSHEAVSEAAVVGVVVDDVSRIQAYIIPTVGHEPGDELADALRAWCKERLRRYEYPHVVTFVQDFPRTVTGKVQRFRLREDAAALATEWTA